MKRLALAVLFALSLPAAAGADDWREPRRAPAPPVLRDDWRDVRQLDRLLARYDEAAAARDRRAMARLEEKLLAAIDEEIAEARRLARRPGHGYGYDHGQGYDRGDPRRAEQARFELSRLMALRGEFAALQGRFGWRATQRKLAVATEVSRLARADLRRGPYAGPVAWSGR
jgi:hypothetical protein